MRALMQDWSLTLDKIFDNAARWHGDREVVTPLGGRPRGRSTYAQAHRRAKQVSHGLLEAGVRQGDRVATMGWNSDRHLEVWYGAIGIGAVLHTLNRACSPSRSPISPTTPATSSCSPIPAARPCSPRSCPSARPSAG